MRFLRKFFKFIFFILLLLVVAVWLVTRYLSPNYNGEFTLKNISAKTVVFYDDNGVPHIHAENQKDAYTTFGYVHAQDRLWQMELIRRIVAGRLSEMFGKDLVRVDKFMSGLGVEEEAFKTIANLDKNTTSYKLTQAYLDGINQYIENNPKPLEFYLLGIEKEKYTINDIYNVFGYMAFSFAIAHKTDPLVEQIYTQYGKEYVKELDIPTVNTALIESSKDSITKVNFLKGVNEIVKKIPAPLLEGSNSWVLGGKRTKNGKVIFANDPHIGYGQPSVWYQNHIKTPNYEMYGFNLALTPFPLLGHNRNYAYGLTMFENDDVDFYREKNNPDNLLEYKTADGYDRYKVMEKTIKIKDCPDSIYQIKYSKHGPVINDVIDYLSDSKEPIAMQWIYTKLPNKVLEITYNMSHSDSLSDFKYNLKDLHAPGLNVMYGDAKGNVAWFAAAKLYTYRDSLNRKLFLNGASGKDEIQEILPFYKNPQAINPRWNYVYSANNQPDSVAGMLYPGYYLPEDRAKRIVELIEPKYDFTQKDIQKMILDVKSSVVPKVITDASRSIVIERLNTKEKNALKFLQSWDGQYAKNAVAPTIYTRFVYAFLNNTFKDEMKTSFEQFISTPLQKKMVAFQMRKTESVWWDDINTKDVKETKEQIITKSFKDAVSFLSTQLGEDIEQWKWEKVISVEHEHAIGKAGGLLRTLFNVGPFNVHGSNQVINNQIFKLDESGYYKVTAGPSTRRVIDFSQLENSSAIIPTGQSGNRFSPFYKNQAEKYHNGEFERMLINTNSYKNSKNRLVFLPKL